MPRKDLISSGVSCELVGRLKIVAQKFGLDQGFRRSLETALIEGQVAEGVGAAPEGFYNQIPVRQTCFDGRRAFCCGERDMVMRCLLTKCFRCFCSIKSDDGKIA